MRTSMPLESDVCTEVTQMLAQVLSNTYVLYVKTQNFHWNVVDPRFYSLHLLFEKQYEELADALDDLAERIRMIGGKAPGSMQEFQQLATLEEGSSNTSGDEMIQQLMEDHTVMADAIRASIASANDLGDDGTADLLVQRLRSHEKSSWMLRSHQINAN